MVADRSVRVVLRANVADFKAQMRQASKSLDDVVKASDRTATVAQTRLGRLTQSMQYQREAWDSAGNSLLGYGAALTFGMGYATKKFADFDRQMSAVKAATHENAANMGLLRAAAMQAGADTAYSATEAAQAIEEMAKAGVSTADIMGGGLSAALSLAAAGELEVGQAAEIASMALTQFKLKGSDLEHVADLLSAGAGKAMGSVDDMAMALKQSGLIASQTGLTIEETTGALSAFAANGLLGSDAGTSFKTMLQRLNPTSKKAAETMADLGLNFYNAKGEFVGIVETAGQLQRAFEGLTDQEIAEHMTTLFGSDAVRAASVLYAEGADGIQDWINKVNDSGYAAETAKLRMDNLSGDIEKMTGSLETLFLKSGSGLNDTLRVVVQFADGIIDAISSLSPETLSAIGMFGALAGANMLARGAMLKFIPVIVDARRAFKGLDASVPFIGRMGKGLNQIRQGLVATKTSITGFAGAWRGFRAEGVGQVSALSHSITPIFGGMVKTVGGFGRALLGAVGGPVGLAITGGLAAITYAISQYGEAQAEAKQKAEEYRAAIEAAAGDLKAESIQKHIAKELQDAKVFDALKAADIDLSIGVQAVTDDVSFARVKDQFAKQKKAIQAELDAIDSRATETPRGTLGVPVKSYSAEDSNRQASLVKLMTTYDAAERKITETRRAMNEEAAAYEEATAAADESTAAHERNAEGITEAAQAAEKQTEALKELVEAQADLAGIVLSSRKASRQFREAIDEAAESVAKHGQNLDTTTEGGRANQKALDGIADSAWDLVKARQAEGASEQELQKIMEDSRSAFLEAAEAMDMNADEAKELADRLGLIPSNVKTEIKQSGAEAVKGKADEVKNAVNSVPANKHLVFTYSGIGNLLSDLWTANQEIRRLSSVKSGGRGHTLAGYAEGGAVRGAGSGTSDSILARLSNGEHVLTASDVRKFGGHEAVYALRAAIQGGRVGRFASGGAVGRAVAVPAVAGASVSVSIPDRISLYADDDTFMGNFRTVVASETIRTMQKAGY